MNHNYSKRQHVRQLGHIESNVLDDLTLGDMLYSFLLSGRSTKQFYRLARERATYRYRRKLAIERLIDNEYIRVQGERLSITERGHSMLGKTIEKTFGLLQTEVWDHKWRIAIFDIPEKYSELRDKVRAILKRAGFAKLQQSVWVFPHECEELVNLIKKESKLSKFILYGVLESIHGEETLKKLFRI